MTAPLYVLAGAMLVVLAFAAWTLAEYLLHRFVMHEMKGKGLASREHLRHHAERDSVLESWYYAWTGVVIVGTGLGAAATALLGPIGICLGAGWVAAYGVYDWMHWRAHRRPVANAYERWIRRHHFHHHFGHPMTNHGVTTPLWDMVFGTYVRVDGPLRVPRRMAMVWLVDDDGAVRPEYAADYELAGSRPWNDQQAALDHDRAFANLAPVI
jgi:sterol desaturase/sphingolipid hydroxylase (fatty acid hydroxylase superfamily)